MSNSLSNVAIDFNFYKSIIVVAGVSGAGRSVALNILEDLGYTVVDNLLPQIFSVYLNELRRDSSCSKVAMTPSLVSDTHVADTISMLRSLKDSLLAVEHDFAKLSLLFLDSSTATINKRYSETRRPHPRFDPTQDNNIENSIRRERSRLQPLKEIADLSIDTTDLAIHDLRREITTYLDQKKLISPPRLRVNILSFGYKHGVPRNCDLLIDVRFIDNPHSIPELRPNTGLDAAVAKFVLEQNDTIILLEKYTDLLKFLLPRYAATSRAYLTIGVGCTGGKHRSVAVAEQIRNRLTSQSILSDRIGYFVDHRDISLKSRNTSARRQNQDEEAY